jgi:hypothetical protein
MSAQRGDIAFWHDTPSTHPIDLLIELRSPHYAHLGICVDGPNQLMIAASFNIGGVNYQKIGDGPIVRVKWTSDFDTVVFPWMYAQLTKPYDVGAFILAAIDYSTPTDPATYICSSFVAAALVRFAGFPPGLARRDVIPDEVAKAVGLLG